MSEEKWKLAVSCVEKCRSASYTLDWETLLWADAELARLRAELADKHNEIERHLSANHRLILSNADARLENQNLRAIEKRCEDVDGMAKAFHYFYEMYAPSEGYKTREDCQVTWDKLPENNRRLMLATCRAVSDYLTGRLNK